ncbi:retrovirus-related pol polyprotein from transposon TNT 1-94 [Tanacetum coccineum]
MVTKEWQVFAKLQRNTNHVKVSKLASLFGKLKYEENLIDSIYETEKNKSLVSTTALSTAFFSTSIVQYFQDIPDDEEDTRSNHEYLNDLEEEYQARALLAKSKRFFKKGTQSVSVNKSPLKKREFWVLINSLKILPILGKTIVFVKSLADDTKVSIPGVERPWLSKAKGLILPNHDTGRILTAESQRNITDPSVAVTDSSVTYYDYADESSVCSTSLPPLKKLNGDEPISGPKTIKSILRIISLERVINPRNPQHAFKRCEVYGSSTHTTTDHYDIEWFKRGEVLQAKKTKALKSTRAESSNANRSKTPTKSGCSRHMTSVKSYLHKYVEQPGPKVVFGDDFTCTTEGYGSIKCNGIVFTKVAFVDGLKYNLISINQLCDAKYIVQFDEKRGTIFNSNKEVVMIAPRVRDVYVLDMTSSTQESCFFAKDSENLNWLWHKRLAHLNFKTIKKLKQNLVIGLLSLVYSKDKPCVSCDKGKHHRASFKTKQTSSIKKCLHLLHMDLFGPVTPRSINHEK